MEKRKSKKLRLILSVIALVEVLAIAVGITFSWVEGGNRGTVKGNEIVISSGSNLTMMQDGNNTNSITIPACTLEETSSSDGRNYFFPMGDNKSSQTAKMTFREGTVSDKNKKYVSIDFDLIANSSAADVYLGAGTIVQSKNKNLMNALRMSFSTNDGTTPVVFKPNQMPGIEAHYSPIVAITSDGVPTTGTSTTKSYGDYYYEGENASTPLFSIGKDETKHITLSIWLEGTAFTSDDVANQDLSIYIDFTTQIDDLIKYNFIDNGHNRNVGADPILNTWVADNMTSNNIEYETMMYIYDVSSKRYYAMQKTSSTTWEAYISKSITNFYFRRYSIDIDTWWNEWEPSMTDIPTLTDSNGTTYRTFVNICGNGETTGTNLDGCYGYWKDAEGTYRIYFQLYDDAGWNSLRFYAWNDSEKAITSGTYGEIMQTAFYDSNTKATMYYYDLKETDNVNGFIFNNSNWNTKIEFDRDNSSQEDYFFNGFTAYKTKDSTGCYVYTFGQCSMIYPVNDPTP